MLKAGIPSNEDKPFSLGLRDQYTIKRVAMMKWELAGLFGMKKCNGKMNESFLVNLGIQVVHGFQLAQCALDGDFIATGSADKYFVIRLNDNVSYVLLRLVTACTPPQEHMGIE